MGVVLVCAGLLNMAVYRGRPVVVGLLAGVLVCAGRLWVWVDRGRKGEK